MLSLFKRKFKLYGNILPVSVDMHSHLLPGIDDGCKTFDESVELIKKFIKLGYKKLIVTPHIMGGFFPNTPEIIYQKLDQLRDIVSELGLDIQLEAAAEYYLDEHFMKLLQQPEPLMSFGKEKYVLFETSYMNASPYLDAAIFELQSKGYKPVMAHPERYVYLFEDHNLLYDLVEKGVHLQVNANSLAGYYSKPAQKIAQTLIIDKVVSFLGSDCHGQRHFDSLLKARETDYYYRALQHGLLNNSLLSS
ncbi:MAG: capsular biosynthesis protein [Cytophagales bacterium]|nr:MAG: capsular biosynthesis protein [Cytophagales bacterium]TAF60762.1 MAG: capsular biosynthesis protein [Cytophagales bacterium]